VGLTGMKLQGYSAASDGSLSTTVGDITIPTGSLEGTATTSITLEAALAAGNAVPTGSTLALSVPPVWSDLTNGSNTVTTSTKVYDSLGNSHDVTLAFTRVGTGSTYEFEAFVDAGDTGGTPGEIVSIGSGSLAFDTSGNLDAANSTAPTGTPVTFTGAAAQTIGFDFGLATGDTGALTMRGNTAINPTNVSPDGNPSGTLATFDIGADGVVTGIYSNGESRALGQVVVASFVGESFLTRVGHNMWQQSKDSGEPVIGEPGTGGRGATVSYALEMSNVDLEQQFVKLIQSQKGYQANTRIVSTADDMLQELMQTV
jgi:flagellar hook protein FlgE